MANFTGERPIASLRVGHHVTNYDSQTGKATTQMVQQVFIIRDIDHPDVTLALGSATA